jgi:hypothetical protein
MTALKAHPETLDLFLYAGDGVTVVIEFVNEDDGSVFPTTGEWLAEIRSYETVVDAFTVTNDEATGTIRLSLTGDQVTALWPSAYWDLQQISPGAEPHTWYRGKITIEGDVSRG